VLLRRLLSLVLACTAMARLPCSSSSSSHLPACMGARRSSMAGAHQLEVVGCMAALWVDPTLHRCLALACMATAGLVLHMVWGLGLWLTLGSP